MNFFSAYNMNIKTLLLRAKPQKQIIQICFKRNLLYPIRFLIHDIGGDVTNLDVSIKLYVKFCLL